MADLPLHRIMSAVYEFDITGLVKILGHVNYLEPSFAIAHQLRKARPFLNDPDTKLEDHPLFDNELLCTSLMELIRPATSTWDIEVRYAHPWKTDHLLESAVTRVMIRLQLAKDPNCPTLDIKFQYSNTCPLFLVDGRDYLLEGLNDLTLHYATRIGHLNTSSAVRTLRTKIEPFKTQFVQLQSFFLNECRRFRAATHGCFEPYSMVVDTPLSTEINLTDSAPIRLQAFRKRRKAVNLDI